MSGIVIVGKTGSGKTMLAQRLCQGNDTVCTWTIFCCTREEEQSWQKAGFNTILTVSESDISEIMSSIQLRSKMGFVFDTTLPVTAKFTELFRLQRELELSLIIVTQGGYPMPEMLAQACNTWYILRMTKEGVRRLDETLRLFKQTAADMQLTLDRYPNHGRYIPFVVQCR